MTRRRRRKHHKTRKVKVFTSSASEPKPRPFADFEPISCSPAVKGQSVNEHSCLTPDILLRIRDEYNATNATNPIVAANPLQIWNELRLRNSKCKSEDCWLRNVRDKSLRRQIKKYVFAPSQPPDWKDNPREWLSNFDIEQVMKQYEVAHPRFKFIGPTFVDFRERKKANNHCVSQPLCDFSLTDCRAKNIDCVGIVFNLSKYDDDDGSHWVSMFIDIKNNFIFYLDSGGDRPPKSIDQFAKEVQAQGTEMMYIKNKRQHQFGASECGMYSLFFIITMLTGKAGDTSLNTNKDKFDFFQQQRIPDRYMLDLRPEYFNP
jgi:hypothetical protein